MSHTYIGIVNTAGETFSNTKPDDLILYAAEPARLVLGTQSNVKPKITIGSSNTIITDNTLLEGRLTVLQDLYIFGNLVTKQDLLLTGNQVIDGFQVASGATFCNGDLYVINNSSNGYSNASSNMSSNSTLHVHALYGAPILSLWQKGQSNTSPFKILQSLDHQGYITNTGAINIRTGSNQHFTTFSPSGFVGIGTSSPRAKLDVYRGDVNAANVVCTRTSTSTTTATLTIHWENIVETEGYLTIETLQQVSIGHKKGARSQKHDIYLSSLQFDSHVSFNYGEKDIYAYFTISSSFLTPTSICITSSITCPVVTLGHDLRVDVISFSKTLGHVWFVE